VDIEKLKGRDHEGIGIHGTSTINPTAQDVLRISWTTFKMKFKEKLLFMWTMFGFSLFWQIRNSDLASPYAIRVYTTDDTTIDSVKIMFQKEE
jgi:hypothetical protein